MTMGSNLPARTCAKELRIADRLQHGEGWTDADHLSAKPAEPAPNNRDVGFQFISASATCAFRPKGGLPLGMGGALG